MRLAIKRGLTRKAKMRRLAQVSRGRSRAMLLVITASLTISACATEQLREPSADRLKMNAQSLFVRTPINYACGYKRSARPGESIDRYMNLMGSPRSPIDLDCFDAARFQPHPASSKPAEYYHANAYIYLLGKGGTLGNQTSQEFIDITGLGHALGSPYTYYVLANIAVYADNDLGCADDLAIIAGENGIPQAIRLQQSLSGKQAIDGVGYKDCHNLLYTKFINEYRSRRR